ncbi:hypothetical protein [Pseudidiomarina homiensis]|uniref:hypothetical protein n=1 Tax=Pseudidiomarina homiensis TaxID=364198 RepID=UPI00215A3AC0|nr:hypothetical protein [Pseudidiomarina homiensis]
MSINTSDVYDDFISVMEGKALPNLKSTFQNVITSLKAARLPFWLCGEFCYFDYIEPRMSSEFDLLVCSSEKSLIHAMPWLTYDEQLDCYSHSSHYDSQWPYTFRIFRCDADSELIPEKADVTTAFGLSGLPLLPIDNWVLHEKMRLDTNLTGSEHSLLRAYFGAIFEKGITLSESSTKTIMDELNLSYEDDSIAQFRSGLSWAEVQALKLKNQG